MTPKLRSVVRTLALLGLLVLATGCTNGQWVDAGGDRGQGGLAFILLAVMFWLFIGSLFYMDRIRRRGDDRGPHN